MEKPHRPPHPDPGWDGPPRRDAHHSREAHYGPPSPKYAKRLSLAPRLDDEGHPTHENGLPIIDLDQCEDIGPLLSQQRAAIGERIASYPTDSLRGRLNVIYRRASARVYGPRERLLRLALNQELEVRGLAPFWRQQPRGFYNPGMQDPIARRYALDTHIIDLLWIRKRLSLTRPSHWDWFDFGILFDREYEFDYQIAEQYARSEITTAARIKQLKLADQLQLNLCYLRSKGIADRQRSVLRRLPDVQSALETVAFKNAHRGTKMLQRLNEWLEVWVSHELGQSGTASMEVYRSMLGRDANDDADRFRRMRRKVYDALDEAGGRGGTSCRKVMSHAA